MKSPMILVTTLLLLVASSAAAITIDAGPTYSPPGMGNESVSGTPDTLGGMMISDTGMDLGQTEELYFGIRNDLYVSGFSMDGGGISGSEIFRFVSASPNVITYSGSTVLELLPGPVKYTTATRMTITFSGPGTMIQDATTHALSGPNGDVGALWNLSGDFSVVILMEAQVPPGDPNAGNWEPGRDLFDRLETTGVSTQSGSSVDWAFYYEALDSDGDGVADDEDNCVDVPNPAQIDSNIDGYGNICDPDFDNDDLVAILDFNELRTAFGEECGDSGYDADIDLNSDCLIGILDFNTLRTYFGGPPGPSGLSCAGTIPCPGP